MKHYYISLFFLSLIPSLFAQTNRALIVAISNYPARSGWEELHAYNDAKLMYNLLTSKKYRSEHITILSDQMATKRNICNGLGKIYQQAQAGDHIYLHFSCHGQQMMDDTGDEDDGLDEALIPVDALFWYIPGQYTGENHLRDDELGAWIDKIRQKAGSKGLVTVVLDACHSGTGNRVNEHTDYIRGTAAIFAPEDYTPQPGRNTELSMQLKTKPGFAPTVVFSACRDNEINYEYFDAASREYYGFLTYAFREVVGETKGSLTTAQFMDKLEEKFKTLKPHTKKKKQTPYMECTDRNASFNIGLQ